MYLGNGALKKCFVTINIIKFRKLYVSGVVFCFVFFLTVCFVRMYVGVGVGGGGGGGQGGGGVRRFECIILWKM